MHAEGGSWQRHLPFRRVPILRALGPRAEVVRAFLELADAVLYGPAALGRRERELLALATSEANGADYSAGVHATLLSELGDAASTTRRCGRSRAG